jgi:hypothetical protein
VDDFAKRFNHWIKEEAEKFPCEICGKEIPWPLLNRVSRSDDRRSCFPCAAKYWQSLAEKFFADVRKVKIQKPTHG